MTSDVNPCPGAPHAPPAHAAQTLPLLEGLPDLARCVGAAWHKCEACVGRHLTIASQHPLLTQQAFTLGLMFMAIVLHGRQETPGTTGEELAVAVIPGAHDVLSPQSLTVLRELRLTHAKAPDGHIAAQWDRAQLAALIADLAPQHRGQVWGDALMFLVGVLQGEGRAIAEEAGT